MARAPVSKTGGCRFKSCLACQARAVQGARRARLNQEKSAMSAMEQVREYLKDVRSELTKVSWPTREELRDSTVVVIVTVLLVATFIGIVDQGLNRVVALIFK